MVISINGAEGVSVNGIVILGGSSIFEGFRFAEQGRFLLNRGGGNEDGERPLLTLIPTC